MPSVPSTIATMAGRSAQLCQVSMEASVSEVVRAGLRLLEETESKLERLQRLLDEGEQSGIAEYSLESVITELDNEAH